MKFLVKPDVRVEVGRLDGRPVPLEGLLEGDAGLVLDRRHGDRVHVAQSPRDVIVAVCGGMGNLHALSMPSWGDTKSVTAAIQ